MVYTWQLDSGFGRSTMNAQKAGHDPARLHRQEKQSVAVGGVPNLGIAISLRMIGNEYYR
jgi:hypothetical protein